MEDINTASEVIPLFVYSLKVVSRPGSKDHLLGFLSCHMRWKRTLNEDDPDLQGDIPPNKEGVLGGPRLLL